MKKLICVMAFAVIAAIIAIANPAPAADNGPPALSFAVANISDSGIDAANTNTALALETSAAMDTQVVNLDLNPATGKDVGANFEATLAPQKNCGEFAYNVADGSFYNRAAMFDTDDTYGTHGMRDTGSQRGRAQQSPPA